MESIGVKILTPEALCAPGGILNLNRQNSINYSAAPSYDASEGRRVEDRPQYRPPFGMDYLGYQDRGCSQTMDTKMEVRAPIFELIPALGVLRARTVLVEARHGSCQVRIYGAVNVYITHT